MISIKGQIKKLWWHSLKGTYPIISEQLNSELAIQYLEIFVCNINYVHTLSCQRWCHNHSLIFNAISHSLKKEIIYGDGHITGRYYFLYGLWYKLSSPALTFTKVVLVFEILFQMVVMNVNSMNTPLRPLVKKSKASRHFHEIYCWIACQHKYNQSFNL